MSEEYRLLKEIIEKWDKEKTATLIDKVASDARFTDGEGRIREPFKTILTLKLLGRKPICALLMLDFIKQRGEATIPEIVNFLGSKFASGTPRVEIVSMLRCLEKLQVLKGQEVRPRGRETRSFSSTNYNYFSLLKTFILF